MADVAAEAHVSVKTVSRVVNREPGVRADTEARVRAVIERIGFGRHDGARVAAPGAHPDDRARRRGPRQPLLLADRRGRRARGPHPAAPAHHRLGRGVTDPRARASSKGLMSRRVDGLVIVPADEHARHRTRRAGERHTPIVYVDRPVRGEAADTVLSDNAGGVRSAVEHLVAHGHRSIGFLGDDAEFWTARQRREAFVAHPRRPRPARRARVADGTAHRGRPLLDAARPAGATDRARSPP